MKISVLAALATSLMVAAPAFAAPQPDVTGFWQRTDSDGDPAANLVLSEQRAMAVVDFLVSHGVDRARLRPVGCAARDPLFNNDTAEHKARNRRTEFDIETINGQRPEGYTEACAPNRQ